MRVSKAIEDLVPYEPGKPIEETKREFGLDKVYKLASNENPLAPSEEVLKALEESLKSLNRYPDPASYDLSQFLSKKYDCKPKEILITNGSNEAIDLLIRVFCEPGDAILTSQKAFIAYKICAQASRVETTEVPMKDNFQIDLSAFKKHWTPKHKIIFLPNPNNPTGTYFNRSEWEAFLEDFGNREDVLIVLDEAYVEFVRAKDYPNGNMDLKKIKNLILCRTLSKVYGLAGLRLGYLVGPEKYINYLHRIRNPFNVNLLAQKAALASLQDADYLSQSQNLVWTSLDYFYQELERLGLTYTKSQANFVIFETPGDAKEFSYELLKRGLILRPLSAYGMPRHLRMSIGLKEENKKAIEIIEEVLKNE